MSTQTWNGPALLVPMTIEVLIVNETTYESSDWWFASPNFRMLQNYQGPIQPPLTPHAVSIPGITTGTTPFMGALVYWSLPDGLTRGMETEAGVIQYPAVPNRWIVQRKWAAESPGGGPPEWTYSTWVVASDYIGGPNGSPPGSPYGSQFLNPAGTLANGNIGATLGGWWTLEDWADAEPTVQAGMLSPPLTAVGAGDPTFAAFLPNIIGVFAFPDDLAGSPPVSPGFLSYSVFGVYSNPENDPLYGGPDGWQSDDAWQNVLNQLQWSVGDATDLADAQQAAQTWAAAHGFSGGSSLPVNTICHGQIYNVLWPGISSPPASGAPSINIGDANYVEPKIAAGHSAADTLAAMAALRNSEISSTEVSILQAFQYGNLALSASQPLLDMILQGGWVSSTGGQTAWQVVAPGNGGSGASQLPPQLTEEQAELLMNLNFVQRQFDACTSNIGSLQNELYSLWWKNGFLEVSPPQIPNTQTYLALVAGAAAALMPEIQTQLQHYSFLRQQRDTAFITLQQSLGDLQLQAGPNTPFLAPNDPVVMLSGVRRSFLHGEDANFASGGALFCRFTGQTIDALTLSPSVTIGASSFNLPLLDSAEVVFGSAPLAPELNDLIVESFFLDVSNAPAIAQWLDPAGSWDMLETIQQEQTLIWNSVVSPPFALDQQTLAEFSGLQSMYGLGAIPSMIGVQQWAPPWVPLFMQWEVVLVSPPGEIWPADWPWTLASGASDPFDDFTYQYVGPSPPVTPSGQLVGGIPLKGTSLLTPQASDVLAAQIQNFILNLRNEPDSTSADVQTLQGVLAYIQDADLLAQSLSGFNQLLLQRNPSFFRIPDDTSVNPWQSTPGGSLDPWLAPPIGPQFQPKNYPSPAVAGNIFAPIRAGFLAVNVVALNKMWIVDAFGQVYPINNVVTPTFATDVSPSAPMSPPLAQLKPRITQFSRFMLTFLSAADDVQEVGITPGANPVCGWLLLNNLDQSVLVYAADGTFLGELLPGEDGSTWNLPPDQVSPPESTGPPWNVANVHLKAMIAGILAEDQNDSAALAALMEIMQQTLWTLDPNGGWSDPELQALIGQPLAVVRGSAAFELLGLPAWSQLWPDTGHYNTYSFLDTPFAVQFGSTELSNDGVVGYYVNDDYSQIQSVYSPSPPSSYVGAGPLALTLGSSPLLSLLSSSPPAQDDGPLSSAALLTLIVAPTAAIHAITGIYPPIAFQVPAPFTTPALSDMEIVFRTGPILGQNTGAGMPLPALRQGTWSWLQYQNTASAAVPSAVANTDQTATLPFNPTIAREGWLKLLLGEGSTLFTYAVSPAFVNCSDSPPNDVTLTVTVYNGQGEDILCTEIVFTLPAGTGASDLTANPAIVTAAGSAGNGPWQIRRLPDGRFSARSPGDVLSKGATLTFNFAGIQVNATPGTAGIQVAELSDKKRTGTIAVKKIP